MQIRAVLWIFILAAKTVLADPSSDFNAAKNRWRSASIANYAFTYIDRSDRLVAPKCNVDLVRTRLKGRNSSRSIVLSGLGECPSGSRLPASKRSDIPRTIDGAFAMVEKFLRFSPSEASVEVIYDPVYGFPSHAYATSSMTDSDEGFDISDFSPTR